MFPAGESSQAGLLVPGLFAWAATAVCTEPGLQVSGRAPTSRPGMHLSLKGSEFPLRAPGRTHMGSGAQMCLPSLQDTWPGCPQNSQGPVANWAFLWVLCAREKWGTEGVRSGILGEVIDTLMFPQQSCELSSWKLTLLPIYFYKNVNLVPKCVRDIMGNRSEPYFSWWGVSDTQVHTIFSCGQC